VLEGYLRGHRGFGTSCIAEVVMKLGDLRTLVMHAQAKWGDLPAKDGMGHHIRLQEE
jgi:hypothetical protein